MTTIAVSRLAPPAPMSVGEVVLGATVTAGGGIGLLTTTEPELARGFIRGPNGNLLPYYEPGRSCSSMLLRFEAGSWNRIALDHLPVSYPMLALLPGGEALVVCPKAPWTQEGRNPRNAHVFADDGAHVRALVLGDDIEGLTVDDAGGIWTSHGEEGWDSVGGSGLVRWAADGTRLWASGLACHEAAVNATPNAAWSYSRPTELTRFRDGVRERYDSPLHDVHAIAFDGIHLLLAGAEHPGGRLDRLYRAVLIDGRVIQGDRVRVVDPAGRPLDWSVLTSHGSRLYLNDHGDGFHVLDLLAAG